MSGTRKFYKGYGHGRETWIFPKDVITSSHLLKILSVFFSLLITFGSIPLYPKKRDTPAYFNNIHAFSKNIITNNFFYLPYFSSSLLNGTLLIILKLKLRWDSACTEDAREYFFCCDDTDNIVLEWTLFQVIVSALISSWPDRFSMAKLKCTIKTF